MKGILSALLVALTLAIPSFGQTAPTPIQNVYAAGASYSPGAQPGIAGTALYAHLLDAGTGTYGFTSIDALPASLSPFTVTSNVGVGVAQKLTTIGKINIYAPTSAGISWTGANTGYQYNGGILAAIHLKNNNYLYPAVRFLKSNVPSGNGFQPIIGLYYGRSQ